MVAEKYKRTREPAAGVFNPGRSQVLICKFIRKLERLGFLWTNLGLCISDKA